MNDLGRPRRQLGRTTKLIKATPLGGIYVVHSESMVPVVNGYLKKIGREGELTVVSISDEQDTEKLRGLKAPIAIDHVVFQADREAVIALMMSIQQMPLILTNDYEGDVTTTYKA